MKPFRLLLLAVSTLGLLSPAGCGKGGGSSGGSAKDDGDTPAADFTGADGWVNTDHPLSIAGLRGQVVVLNFWTYGSIRCLQVFPELKLLEEKYRGEPVVVLGIHSGKFDQEKDVDCVREAVRRCDISSPVAVDSGHHIWDAYKVKSWPTLAVIDPEGHVARTYSGEGHGDELSQLVATLLESGRKKGTLGQHLTFETKPQPAPAGVLAFPGKVLADAGTGRLFISDTNHNRVLLADLNGRVARVIGGGRAGLKDGDFASAQFRRPQGLALSRDGRTLYVADTENHALRAIDLKAGSVATLAGTGSQSHGSHPDGDGRTTELSSPWDVACVGDTLYLAMAGAHQLWAYDPATGRVRDFAGTGSEGDHDGAAAQAGFAQPSGIAADGGATGGLLYVADAEDSSIRAVSPGSRPSVRTIAGSGDLFGFGRADRPGQQARFQHPLGVALASGDAPAGEAADTLFVADTYNNVIRTINLKSFTVATLAGSGRHDPGSESGLTEIGFFEPGGLSLAGDTLFVADTNHHRIVALDLKAKKVRVLDVQIRP